MDEETVELLESIDNRLKWILQIEIESRFDDDATNQEKIKTLYKMGFSNQEMAEIVGTSQGSVRGTLTHLRQDGEIT